MQQYQTAASLSVMIPRLIVLLAITGFSAAMGADIGLSDGRVFENAVIVSESELMVTIRHSGGLTQVEKRALRPLLDVQTAKTADSGVPEAEVQMPSQHEATQPPLLPNCDQPQVVGIVGGQNEPRHAAFPWWYIGFGASALIVAGAAFRERSIEPRRRELALALPELTRRHLERFGRPPTGNGEPWRASANRGAAFRHMASGSFLYGILNLAIAGVMERAFNMKSEAEVASEAQIYRLGKRLAQLSDARSSKWEIRGMAGCIVFVVWIGLWIAYCLIGI